MVMRALGVVRRIKVPNDMEDLRRTIDQQLSAALALYERNDQVSGQELVELRAQAEDRIREAAVALYQTGASGCAPTSAPDDRRPISSNAGPLDSRPPVATITLGPSGIDDNRIIADATAVWVGLRNINQMVRIDPATNEIVARVDIGASPGGKPAIVDGFLWIDTAQEVLRIDPATNKVDRRFPRGALGYVSGAEAAFTSTAIYACGEGSLRVVDPDSGALRRSVPVKASCTRAHARGDEVWLSLAEGAGLVRVDPITGAELARLDVPGTVFYAFGAGDQRWATGSDGNVYRFDGRTGEVTGQVRRAGQYTLQGTAGGGAAWLTADEERRVIRVDAGTLRLLEFAAGDGVNAVAYHGGSLWAANSDAGTVMRFDVSDLESTTSDDGAGG